MKHLAITLIVILTSMIATTAKAGKLAPLPQFVAER